MGTSCETCVVFESTVNDVWVGLVISDFVFDICVATGLKSACPRISMPTDPAVVTHR